MHVCVSGGLVFLNIYVCETLAIVSKYECEDIFRLEPPISFYGTTYNALRLSMRGLLRGLEERAICQHFRP